MSATPGPWQRPVVDISNRGRIIADAAPSAPLRSSHAIPERDPLHKIVAWCSSDAIAAAIVALHEHAADLTDATIWEKVRVALRDATGPASGMADAWQFDRVKITSGPGTHGEYVLTAPTVANGLALQRREVCTVLKASGEDADDDARLIAHLLVNSRRMLDEAAPAVIAVRGIGPVTIVIDADRVQWFEAKHWTATDNGDVIERKTGHRLADLITGVDGLWSGAGVSKTDGFHLPKGALDYRRACIQTCSRTRAYAFNLPPETFAAIEANARTAGQDVAAFIADRCSHG